MSRRKGRVEAGLDRELAGLAEIGPGARAHLRATAHGVDLAEAEANPVHVAKAASTYVEVRQAYGLAGLTNEPAPDPFAAFIAGLSAPSLGHPTDP